MESFVEKVKEKVKIIEDELFDMACKIFDRPEIGGEENFAVDLLISYLEKHGFSVERGIAGLPTAFRATWETGESGPAIGFCMEYDALKDLGHACGHHLQGPACIGAALVLKELCNKPFRLVLYGTPDEEDLGGKIAMAKQGCFTDVDIMLAYHSAGSTFPSNGNRALSPFQVTFRGTTAHASGAPHEGRSALDAMMLAFHGLEIMREHVKDGCRIHYTVLNGTGPCNVVHEEANCQITLRSFDKHDLDDMKRRMKKIIEGACLMTETAAEIIPRPEYHNFIPLEIFHSEINRAAALCGAENITKEKKSSGGSSDIGNVSWVCPTAYFYVFYSSAKAHSADYLTEGKAESAKKSMTRAMEIASLVALEFIHHPEKMEKAKAEHKIATQNS